MRLVKLCFCTANFSATFYYHGFFMELGLKLSGFCQKKTKNQPPNPQLPTAGVSAPRFPKNTPHGAHFWLCASNHKKHFPLFLLYNTVTQSYITVWHSDPGKEATTKRHQAIQKSACCLRKHSIFLWRVFLFNQRRKFLREVVNFIVQIKSFIILAVLRHSA